MTIKQTGIVHFLIWICSIILLLCSFNLLSNGDNVYAAEEASLYDAIPIFADGTEGDVVHAVTINGTGTPINRRNLKLVQLPEDTVRVKFYGADKTEFWQPEDYQCQKTEKTFTKEEYAEDSWWIINVSELSFKVKTVWYENTLSKNQDYFVKQADYYELTDKAGNTNSIEHYFIQIGDANSPLNVYACKKDAYPVTWSETEFAVDNKLKLDLGCGKRLELFGSDNQDIYYTTDGTDPTSSDSAKKYSDTLQIEKTCVILAATKSSNNKWGPISQFRCTVNAPLPTFSPDGGWYSNEREVSISCQTFGAEIYYTIDGTEPIDESGNLIESDSLKTYEGPITVDSDQTIKAVAKADDLISMVATSEYRFSTGIDIEFNGDDQGVWLIEDTVHTPLFGLDKEGTIVTPYGHPKCSIVVSAAEGAALKLNDTDMQRETSGEYDGKYILDLDVRENAELYDFGAENVITVTNGDKNATYKIYCIASKYDDVPDKVADYFVPASQYTNNGYYGVAPNRTLIGKPQFNNGSSLGNYGGYITWYYEDGISNDPDNPYGVDFIVFGNSFDGTNEAAEPGNIMVSEDGEEWYTLAGSIHYDENAVWDTPVFYYPDENGFASYELNGAEDTSRFLFPKQFFYPLHTQTDDFEGFFTLGTFLVPDSGTNVYGNIRPPYPAFGYADVCASTSCDNEAENPYAGIFADTTYGDRFTTKRNGDACDISWAVNEQGFPANLETIRYVKVQTASFIDNGAIGEKSTEVNVMRKAKKAEEPVGVTDAPESIKIDGVAYDGADINPNEVMDVYVEGIFDIIVDAPEDTNVYINSIRSHTAFLKDLPSDKNMVRIIVQEGKKEPLIYYFNIEQDSQPESKKVTEITFKTRKKANNNLKGLLHDKDQLICYYDADTIEHFDGNVPFDDADSAKENQGFVWWESDEGEAYKAFDANMAEIGGQLTLLARFDKKADIDAAKAVTALIDALPEVEDITKADKEAITEAAEAYDNLTDKQKDLIIPSDLQKLSSVRVALFDAFVEEIPEDATENDEGSINAAQEIYDSLPEELKPLATTGYIKLVEAKLSVEKDKLETAQQAVRDAQTKYDALKEESDADKEELAQAKADLAAEKAKAEAAQGDADKYEEELAILKAQNAILKKTVKKVKAKAKKKSALVSWKSVGKGFKYEVYRSTNPTKSFKKVKTAKKLKVTVKKLKKGKTYYFKVRAFKKVGGKKVYTGYSNIAKVKIKK